MAVKIRIEPDQLSALLLEAGLPAERVQTVLGTIGARHPYSSAALRWETLRQLAAFKRGAEY